MAAKVLKITFNKFLIYLSILEHKTLELYFSNEAFMFDNNMVNIYHIKNFSILKKM